MKHKVEEFTCPSAIHTCAASLPCIIPDRYFRLLFMMRCWPRSARWSDTSKPPRGCSTVKTYSLCMPDHLGGGGGGVAIYLHREIYRRSSRNSQNLSSEMGFFGSFQRNITRMNHNPHIM